MSVVRSRRGGKGMVQPPTPPRRTGGGNAACTRPSSPSRPSERAAGASASEKQELVTCRDGVAVVPFAVPANPYPFKPIPPNVLQEEDYVDAVGAIIERDFFPDLPQLRARHELVSALRSGDLTAAHEAELKLAHLPRPTPASAASPAATPRPPASAAATPTTGACPSTPGGATPQLGGATPQHQPNSASAASGTAVARQFASRQHLSAWERDDDGASSVGAASMSEPAGRYMLTLVSGKEFLVDLSRVRLDDFQRVFTSEDNASFEAILQRDMERLREKEWWMELAEQNHNTEYQEQRRILENGGYLTNEKVMCCEFKARHAVSFTQHGLPLPQGERPRVDFKNTRFTTSQHAELENRLGQSIVNRKGELADEQAAELAERMARDGRFDLGVLKKTGIWSNSTRAIGGVIQASPMPNTSENTEVNGYGFVRTPTLLPGVDGLSPLMTYGKIASTPALVEEDVAGPNFRIVENSEREEAAERLQRSSMQKARESRRLTKSERLRALGLSPASGTAGTPAASSRTGTPASRLRRTPGSGAASSSKIVTPLSPIGQLIHRAKRMAQEGGRLRISGASPGRTPLPNATEKAGGVGSKRAGADGSGGGGAAASTSTAQRPPRKRARHEAALPASITDGLL